MDMTDKLISTLAKLGRDAADAINKQGREIVDTIKGGTIAVFTSRSVRYLHKPHISSVTVTVNTITIHMAGGHTWQVIADAKNADARETYIETIEALRNNGYAIPEFVDPPAITD